GFRDCSRWIAVLDFAGQPTGFLGALDVAQELVNVMQSRTRKHALVADMLEAAEKIAQQIDLDFVGGREIAMSALGGKWPEPSASFGQQARLAQSSAGGNQHAVSCWAGRSLIQCDEVGFLQQDDAVRVGEQVVDQVDAIQA